MGWLLFFPIAVYYNSRINDMEREIRDNKHQINLLQNR